MWRFGAIRNWLTRNSRRRVGEFAFAAVLALAIGVGGGRAISGLPILAKALVPPGLFAAQAEPDAQPASVRIAVRIDSASPYGPALLEPVAANPIPQWLSGHSDRDVQARLSPPAMIASHAPEIAIVIDDLGADAAATRRAIALPGEVTLSFLPYPETTPVLAREGARAEHEVIVHVPMEPEGTENPGPGALRVTMSAGQISQLLGDDLARVPGAVGINNHMGSKFTADRAALVAVDEALAAKHLFFLDSRTTPDTVVVPTARAFDVASAGRDVFLDDEQQATAVDKQLAETESRAREQGVAIAIGHPHAVTLSALEAWTKTVTSRGFVLIPVSAAIRAKTEREVLLGGR
jgi:uncharacterized protein